MVDDLLPPPTLEERLQSARTRFALLAEVLDLHALGIEHMDHALGPDGSPCAGRDVSTGSRGPAETPERPPSGSAQLVRRGQAAGRPAPMSLMRTYRRALTLSQSAFAAQLNVPRETYRPWDAGRREPPPQLLTRARTLAGYPDETVLLPLPVLALMNRRACSHAARSRAFRPTNCCL